MKTEKIRVHLLVSEILIHGYMLATILISSVIKKNANDIK